MQKIRGDLCHEYLCESLQAKLQFQEQTNFAQWQTQLRDKLQELVGLNSIRENACPLQVTVENETQKEGYKQIRFVFESEKGAFVPCYLLIPDTGKEKYPVAITLQGHSSGFHNSIGEPKTEAEKEYALGRGQFAVQAVERGFAALAIEQRAMGERVTDRHDFSAMMCLFTAMTALQLGRTVVGERIWDVSCAINALQKFPVCDLDKIFITGNSGGGTAAFYAACLDKRIRFSVPSCSFCSYKTSIMDTYHCTCNYVPHALEWFEMQDLAGLIAPRALVAVTGVEDPIFPIEGVRNAFEKVRRIYEKAGAKENCRLVETPKAHWWCEDIVWQSIEGEVQRLGWR